MSQTPPPPPLPQGQPKGSNNATTIIVIVCVVAGGFILVCGGLLAGILLPALGQAREIAHRTVSAANLNGTYMAMYTYSVSNDDQFPTHVGILLTDGSMDPESFVSPSHNDAASAPTYTGQPPATPYYRFGDYFWTYEGLGGKDGEAMADPEAIIAFSLSHDGEGRNVLFADGHTEFMDETRFRDALAEDGKIRARQGLPAIDLNALGADAER